MRYLILIAIIVMIIGMLNAQVKPAISQKNLSVSDKNVLDKHFKKYKTFSIDKKEVLDSLKNHGKCRVQLTIDKENDWLIDLQINDMRSSDFITTYTSDFGTFQSNSFIPNTYKGKTSDNRIARFTIDDDEFWGIINSNEKQVIIRQTKDYTNKSIDENLIIFEKSDIIITGGNDDFVTDALIAPIENITINTLKTAVLCPYYLQIATEADYEFYQVMGSNIINTYSYIFSILNLIEGVYESTFDLRFKVTFQNVWTTSSDPYTNTTSSETLLNEFTTEWNTNRSGITRDIAHLFTGRNYSGLGIAWVGQIGTNWAYSSGEYRAEMYETTAHEIGHNLNATHPTSSDCLCGGETASVMCTGLKANNLWFCQTSINEISPFLESKRAYLLSSMLDNQTLSGTVNSFKVYLARGKITSTQVIENGLTVYRSKEHELNGGFEVKLGAEFQMIIDDNGCE